MYKGFLRYQNDTYQFTLMNITKQTFFKWLKALVTYDWEILDKVCWLLQINDILMGKKKKEANF